MLVCRKYAVDVAQILQPSRRYLNEAFGAVVTSILLLPERGFGGRGKEDFSPRAFFLFYTHTRWFMLKVCVCM